MKHDDARAALHERFERARRAPPLMMLYPPIATGEAYVQAPDAAALWGGVTGSATLYVHIPFCPERCIFCPFHASVGASADYPVYLEAVLREAERYAEAVGHLEFSSVYFGGGTPSLLPPAQLAGFLERLGGLLRITGADISLEAHPGTVDGARLAEFRAAGVTRLSLGVQSFDPRVLEAAGRGATAACVRPAVEAALATPFHEVNIDLMYGLPNQTEGAWQRDLETAAALEVPGLTLYSTVYLPGFSAWCEKRGSEIADAERRLAMYDLAYDYLGQRGYPQPRFGAGAFQRHGLNAHRRNVAAGRPTLGLGTWAYSTTGRHAYHNLHPLAKWRAALDAAALPIDRIVAIPPAERARRYVVEAMLLAYLDLGEFRACFGVDFAACFPDELAVLQALGLARLEDGELRLTRQGGRHLREVRYLFASAGVVAALESGRAAGL